MFKVTFQFVSARINKSLTWFFAVRIVLVNHVYTRHSTLDLEKEFSDGSQFLTTVLLKFKNKEKLLLFIIKV